MTDKPYETSTPGSPTPGRPEPVAPAAPRSKGGRGLAGLALLIALLAAGASGFLGYQWYQERQAQTAQIGELDARLDSRLTQLRSEVTEQRDTLLQDLRDQLQARQNEIQTLKGMLETQQGTGEAQKNDVRTLQNDVQALKGEIQTVRSGADSLRESGQGQQEQMQALQQQTQELTSSLEQHKETLARIDTRLENLQLSQRGLENSLEAVKVLAAKGGDINALPLSEVEYLLRMADHKLKMQQDVETAVEALRIAVQRLDAIGEKAFLAVERMIRENVAALRAVEMPDMAALTEQISEMENKVGTLPLRVDIQLAKRKQEVVPVPTSGEAAADGEAPWWQRMSSAAWGELKDIVIVRHERTSGPPLMAVEEEYFLRQNLALKLEAMRTALLADDAASFQATRETARAWTQTYFDTDNEEVSALVNQLESMKETQLNPYVPNITPTVRAFRDVMDVREPIRSVTSPAPAQGEPAGEGEPAAQETKP